MIEHRHIIFDPLLPTFFLITMAIVFTIFFISGLKKGALQSFVRLLFSSALFLMLLQPQISVEKRTPLKDYFLIALDKSQSQNFGNRAEALKQAEIFLKSKLQKLSNLEVRTIIVANNKSDETKVFDEINSALSDIPALQRGGIALLTDGQVTDAKESNLDTPLSVILTGSKSEKDRQVKLISAPGYGLLGSSSVIKFKVIDQNMESDKPIEVQLTAADGATKTIVTIPDQINEWPVNILSAGENIFEITTKNQTGELSKENNRAIVTIQGVRNRLHVLLVSGEPYAGARMWRDILKSDPGIDLVHFTILRSPEKIDMASQKDLSLIAFPFQELFENKLKNFDLVIMDGFSLNTMLPDYYFQNIKNYVLNGGALLDIDGPSFSGRRSIYQTSLREILPAAPAGEILEGAFKPSLTMAGKSHPVTNIFSDTSAWGSWLEQMPVRVNNGEVLLTGLNNNPLLILSRTGKGRVAQLTSNQIWLWARGFEGGGPAKEMLRHVVHWLMKESRLDETALQITNIDDHFIIKTRQDNKDHLIEVTKPDGSTEKIPVSLGEDGWLSGNISSLSKGVYKFSNSERKKIVSAGDFSTPEFSNILSTDKMLSPMAKKSGGGLFWYEQNKGFSIHELKKARPFDLENSIVVKRNNSSNLLYADTKPIIKPALYMALLLLLSLLMWWIEGAHLPYPKAKVD